MIIAFEGPDFSGKSSLLQKTKEYFEKRGQSVMTAEVFKHLDPHLFNISTNNDLEPLVKLTTSMINNYNALVEIKNEFSDSGKDVLLLDRHLFSTVIYNSNQITSRSIAPITHFLKYYEQLKKVLDPYTRALDLNYLILTYTSVESAIIRSQNRDKKLTDKQKEFDQKVLSTYSDYNRQYKTVLTEFLKNDFLSHDLMYHSLDTSNMSIDDYSSFIEELLGDQL